MLKKNSNRCCYQIKRVNVRHIFNHLDWYLPFHFFFSRHRWPLKWKKIHIHLTIWFYIQLFRERLSENVHATIPKGNMGYDQYTVPNDCSCWTYFCWFPLALANIFPWPLVPLFQNSLENRGDKTTHNTFQDCRVHFFRQLFSKQLYVSVDGYQKDYSSGTDKRVKSLKGYFDGQIQQGSVLKHH